MLVLHQFQVSPFCDKVRRLLQYKRRPYEVREVPPTETLRRLRRLNPIGKVPVLEHEGHVIADSTEIARYLDRVFPEPSIFPEAPRDRAHCHVLEDWADESLYFYGLWFRFGLPENAEVSSRRSARSEPSILRGATQAAIPTVVRNVLRSQGLGRRSQEAIAIEFARHLETIGEWLGDTEWLVGPRLTLADIAVYAQLAAIVDTPEGAVALGPHPRVLEWMERVNGATAPPA